MDDDLHKIVEAATPGPWHWVDPETDEPRLPDRDYADELSLRTTWERASSVGPLPEFIVKRAEEIRSRADARFIATFDPVMVSVLLDVAEAAKAVAVVRAPSRSAIPRWDDLHRLQEALDRLEEVRRDQ